MIPVNITETQKNKIDELTIVYNFLDEFVCDLDTEYLFSSFLYFSMLLDLIQLKKCSKRNFLCDCLLEINDYTHTRKGRKKMHLSKFQCCQ